MRQFDLVAGIKDTSARAIPVTCTQVKEELTYEYRDGIQCRC